VDINITTSKIKRDIMIVVDIETTGMEPLRNSILSIGALDFGNPENRFYGECRMDKGAEVTNIALKINGFTRREITDPKKPSSKDLLKDFSDWALKIKERTIAGDNIWFDIGFLKEYFRKYRLKWIFKKKYVELHEMSPLLTGLPWSLDAVLYMVGVPPRNKTHNALNDAELTAEAMARVAAGKSIIKNFNKHPVPDIFKNKNMRAVAGI
jgi:DNA polymerase III epsilon subunit-like protein